METLPMRPSKKNQLSLDLVLPPTEEKDQMLQFLLEYPENIKKLEDRFKPYEIGTLDQQAVVEKVAEINAFNGFPIAIMTTVPHLGKKIYRVKFIKYENLHERYERGRTAKKN